MVHRAKELSSIFFDECRHLKSMFNHPFSLVNGIIDKCDPSALGAKKKSDETLRVRIQFKAQVSANTVKKQMRDLS